MTTSTRGGWAPSRPSSAVITTAHQGASAEQSRRQRNYALTMGFRTACFVAMVFVPGVGRWILFACAVFLPYVAVILANQADRRGASFDARTPVPSDAPALTTGDSTDVIEGQLYEGDPPGTDPHKRDQYDNDPYGSGQFGNGGYAERRRDPAA